MLKAKSSMSSAEMRGYWVSGWSLPSTRMYGKFPTFKCRSEALFSQAVRSKVSMVTLWLLMADPRCQAFLILRQLSMTAEASQSRRSRGSVLIPDVGPGLAPAWPPQGAALHSNCDTTEAGARDWGLGAGDRADSFPQSPAPTPCLP